LGIYLHVPFCRTRCGYCDFNTYTPAELRVGPELGETGDAYLDAALAEIDLAAAVLGQNAPPVSTVFVGGGTPTLLASADLVTLVREVVRPTIWKENGGMASIRYFSGKLIVTAPVSVHEAIGGPIADTPQRFGM
jgi:coproporphyrinogen III oxidase-like Fe-S oxidoreductase